MKHRPIVSLQNHRVKEAVKLRQRRQRERQGRFLIDGARELARAIESSAPLVEAFVCDRFCQSTDSRRAQELLADCEADVFEVSPEVFGKLAFGDRGEGVIGVAAIRQPTLDAIALGERPLIVVLDGVEKPGNVGAVLRSADAAGATAVILSGKGTDLFNPNCVRASLGTLFTLPVAEADAADVIRWLARNKINSFAARVDAPLLYTEADLRGRAAIVLGSEARGLGGDWTGASQTPIRLPMHGVADSLNVSTAAAVLLFEAVRQRSV